MAKARLEIGGKKWEFEVIEVTDDSDVTDDDSTDDNTTERGVDDGDYNFIPGNDGNVCPLHRRTDSSGNKTVTVEYDAATFLSSNYETLPLRVDLHQNYGGLQVKLVMFDPPAELAANKMIVDTNVSRGSANCPVAVINLADVSGLSEFSAKGSYHFDIAANIKSRLGAYTVKGWSEIESDYPRDCIVVMTAGYFEPNKNKSGYVRLFKGIDGNWVTREVLDV